ncbi:MAG: RagB/SusD family nutrient uptake outer membrane protein [Phaeodactylibacter sp.]|nr:RagB/SusD family nutrient uptake outer membrane protein [Phaeodactylibacter sp.]MCB9301466.1 RagB/SusD family nutrient uptake outer membrane protein [Lewinellaceae bacterium]HQU58015.1 RagB/SusD family nutrient uptake outer membrane protein [Saprospiraceae bacterium]
MKKRFSTYIKWAVLSAALFLASACEKDFLERAPKGQLTFDTYFETPDHAIWATNAVYQKFRAWEMCAFPWIGITDIISDDADKGSTENDGLYILEIDNFTFDATNQAFQQAWAGHYQTIFRANLAIENIPNIDMDVDLRNRLVGECRFLRAYTYLRLVQWFGELPVITRPLNEDEYFTQERRPVSEAYDLIEQDLLAAIEVLPEKSQYPSGDLGRATKGAARGMLAKLYMVKKDFVNAEKYCREVINSNEYSLLPKYADNFMPVGENGAESIFEIGAVAIQAAVAGPGATPYNMIQGVRGIPNLGWGFNRPSDDLVAAYEPGDPRRQATIIYVGEVLPDGLTIVQDNPEILNERYNQKAWVGAHPGLQDNGPGNIRILRYADILLLAAEAMNENGKSADALEYLNQVRRRARGSNNFILPDITVTDQSQLREIIYHERRVELAMEQHRWFDLLRWGRAESVMTAVGKNFVANKHELLPIPQSEIDLSGGLLKQNQGY